MIDEAMERNSGKIIYSEDLCGARLNVYLELQSPTLDGLPRDMRTYLFVSSVSHPFNNISITHQDINQCIQQTRLALRTAESSPWESSLLVISDFARIPNKVANRVTLDARILEVETRLDAAGVRYARTSKSNCWVVRPHEAVVPNTEENKEILDAYLSLAEAKVHDIAYSLHQTTIDEYVKRWTIGVTSGDQK